MRTMYILRTDDRPTDLAFSNVLNGHISAAGHPIHFMFGSMVGFSRSADQMSLLSDGPNPRSRPSAVMYNLILNGHISDTVHLVQLIFDSRVKV